VQPLVGLDEDDLDEIAGVLGVPRHAEGQVEDRPSVSFDQGPEGPGVAAASRIDQGVFFSLMDRLSGQRLARKRVLAAGGGTKRRQPEGVWASDYLEQAIQSSIAKDVAH